MDEEQQIQLLKSIVKPEQILDDPEDLYVYSFEKIFEKQNPKPDLVIRTLSPEEIKKILEAAAKNRFTVTRRSESRFPQSMKRPLVLIDDVPTPELKQAIEKKADKTSLLKEIREKGYGTLRNLPLALATIFSEKYAAKCQECKTCSGYCTVASYFGGVETYSSKGRTLVAKALHNSELPLSEKIVNILYTCTECGLCFAECSDDLELNQAFMSTRHQIAEDGLAPKVFKETARNIAETGDPAAIPLQRRLSWMKSLSGSPSRNAETLYWVGCMVANRTPKAAVAFEKILDHADLEYTVLAEKEGCCGYVLLSTGFWKEAKAVAEKAIANIKETGVATLVTPCAGCYYTFTRLYPDILKASLPCRVLHSSQLIETLIGDARIGLKDLDLTVSYHDPCSLGRHSGVFEAPRKVLQAIPSLTHLEMPLNKQRARCCGGGGGLWSFNHEVSMDSAYLRLKDLQPLKADALVTACPLCQMNFRYTASRESITTKVFDITELVESALQ